MPTCPSQGTRMLGPQHMAASSAVTWLAEEGAPPPTPVRIPAAPPHDPLTHPASLRVPAGHVSAGHWTLRGPRQGAGAERPVTIVLREPVPQQRGWHLVCCHDSPADLLGFILTDQLGRHRFKYQGKPQGLLFLERDQPCTVFEYQKFHVFNLVKKRKRWN